MGNERETVFNFIDDDDDEYALGDFVECTECGGKLLVNVDTTDCPKCEERNCLDFVDEDFPQMTEEDVKDLGYIVVPGESRED